MAKFLRAAERLYCCSEANTVATRAISVLLAWAGGTKNEHPLMLVGPEGQLVHFPGPSGL